VTKSVTRCDRVGHKMSCVRRHVSLCGHGGGGAHATTSTVSPVQSVASEATSVCPLHLEDMHYSKTQNSHNKCGVPACPESLAWRINSIICARATHTHTNTHTHTHTHTHIGHRSKSVARAGANARTTRHKHAYAHFRSKSGPHNCAHHDDGRVSVHTF
jgi:hypothetical protein